MTNDCYIYRDNKVAYNTLTKAGYNLIPDTIPVYCGDDYNGFPYHVGDRDIYRVTNWPGSSRSFSRYLRDNRLRFKDNYGHDRAGNVVPISLAFPGIFARHDWKYKTDVNDKINTRAYLKANCPTPPTYWDVVRVVCGL